MTNEKALEIIETTTASDAEMLSALCSAVVALEKQIPKKIKIIDGYDLCPACNFRYGSDAIRRSLRHWRKDFCERCGQRLDWSE